MRTGDEDKTGFNWQTIVPLSPAIMLAGFYSFGFLAFNAHLGKYGVYESNIASPRYLIVGFIFVGFLLVWYLLPGRAVLYGLKSFDQKMAKICQLSLHPLWSIVITSNELFRVAFFLCLASKFFSVTFGIIDVQFYFFLAIVFFISYIWDNIGKSEVFPRLDLIVDSMVNISMILAFVKTTDLLSPTFFLFLHMLILTGFVNLVSESFEKFKMTMERSAYNVLFSLILALLSSALFGNLHYGHITQNWGGGQLRPVEMNVDKGLEKVLMDMGFDVESGLNAHLLHEDVHEFVVILEGKTIRLPRTKVVMIKIPAESGDTLHSGTSQGQVTHPP